MISAKNARADVFRRLGTMEQAGIPLTTGLSRVVDQGGAGRALLGDVLIGLEAGRDVAQAFAEGKQVSDFEAQLIAAGYQAGTLPDVFMSLADHYEEQAKGLWALVMALAYPTFLFHAACFLLAVPTVVAKDGGVGAALAEALLPIAALWIVTLGSIGGYRAWKKANPASADAFVVNIPVLGGVAFKESLAVALWVLRVSYQNGIPLLTSLESAASAAPNRVVADMFDWIRRKVASGSNLGEAFDAHPRMPRIAVDMAQTGEQTGHLDETLARAETMLRDEAKRMRTMLVVALGAVVLGGVMLVIAYKIITFWTGFYGGILKDLDGR